MAFGQADDPQRAMTFYGQVFGWTFRQTMETPIAYWEIDGAGILGGLLGRPAAVAPLAWTAALVVIARHELVHA